jgi:hypothetical protein
MATNNQINATELTVNGTKYIPADSIQIMPKGCRFIVVVDRGWVFAGDVKRENGRILISNALHVFTWKEGVANLAHNLAKAKADLRPIGNVDIPMGAEIFSIPVDDNWGK